MMNAVIGLLTHCHSLIKSADGQIAFHKITDNPAKELSRIQIANDCQIGPTLSGPDVANSPVFVGLAQRQKNPAQADWV